MKKDNTIDVIARRPKADAAIRAGLLRYARNDDRDTIHGPKIHALTYARCWLRAIIQVLRQRLLLIWLFHFTPNRKTTF
jgi:hypothetical protein